MKKKIISFLLVLSVISSNSLIVFGDEVTTPPTAEDVISTDNLIIPIKDENFENGIVDMNDVNMDDVNNSLEKTNEKLAEAHEYVQDKFNKLGIDINDVVSKNADDELISNSTVRDNIMSRAVSAGSSKILSYNSAGGTPELQKKYWWCGPAAALNAIDCRSYVSTGKNTTYTQEWMAMCLGTTDQTSFGSRWETTLNKYAPGNRYSLVWANNYANWTKQLMDGIVIDIDNNYPVIVDVQQDPSHGFLTSGYRNYYSGNSICHYITVIGYTVNSNGSCDIRYLDSWEGNHGANTVSLNELASMSRPYGMVF